MSVPHRSAVLGFVAAAAAFLAPGANASSVGLPAPTPANLHVCSRIADELSPWKDRSEETGYTVWGTHYAYDWWGTRGSCAAARFVAIQVVDNRGPSSVVSPYSGAAGRSQRCYITTKDAGNTIEPFASIFCHIKVPRRNFGVLVAPYPSSIDGWFWNDGNPPACTDPDICPKGVQGVSYGPPEEEDYICTRKGGALVCHMSNNPGAGARLTLTLLRHGKQVAQTHLVFGSDAVTTAVLRGRTPLRPGSYVLKVKLTNAGATLQDSSETLEVT
jgi:hypothetical protein